MKSHVQVKVRDVAFLLQRSILNAKRNSLPEHLKLKYILQGEGEVPENMRQFSHYLIYRPKKLHVEDRHERKQQRIKAISEDVVFAASFKKKNLMQTTNIIRVGHEKLNRFQKGY